MAQSDTLRPPEVQLSAEEREQFQEVAEAVGDTIENIEMFLEPGDRFAIHPATFAEAEALEEDEGRVKDLLRVFVFEALGLEQGSLQVFGKVQNEQWFKTKNPDLVVGTDGTDWWLEFASSVPEEISEGSKVNAVRKSVAKKAKKAATPKKPSKKKVSPRRK